MAVTAPVRILIVGADADWLAECSRLLLGAGYEPECLAFAELRAEALSTYQLIMLEAGGQRPEALRCLRLCRNWLGDCFTPVLFVADASLPEARLAGLEAGADACLLRPILPGELLAQCRTLLRVKFEHDRLRHKTTEIAAVNRRLQDAYEQVDYELGLAQRVQQSFLPPALPEFETARFAVAYRPCGQVGGDFYDAFRLDEHHVGFYVADAMGHGVPASLLTIYLKQAVRGKEIHARGYRLVPPAEVLGQLNRDLIAQNLADSRFITMVYGLLDTRDGTLDFARAGHPYPLLIPAAGEPRLLRADGSLLGVFETEFTGQTCRLEPGDKILLYTDGVDAAASTDTTSFGHLLKLAAAHRHLPIRDFVEESTRCLLPAAADDLTLLGVEIRTPDEAVSQPFVV